MNGEEPIPRNPQDEKAFRVAYLLAGYIRENLTEAEHVELDDWVCESYENQRMFEVYTDPKNIDEWMKQYKENIPASDTLDRLLTKLPFTDKPPKVSRIRSFWPYVAAAVALIALALIFELVRNRNTGIQPDYVQKSKLDIAPGGDHATLTLSDGRLIGLDSAVAGTVATQGNAIVNKSQNGQLHYQLTAPPAIDSKPEFNTLSVPYGGKYSVMLPDSSLVTLNSGSTLKYPTYFSGNNRSVTLTGEAYFEVAKNPSRPFEVHVAATTVQVLGTHFNINAYSDEPLLKITLAEGSVQVDGKTTLKPGQQAQVAAAGNIQTVVTDLETELAWKNDQFIFKHTPLDAVMRQVSRWYNCEVVYQSSVSDLFNATLSRSVPVSKVLHYLEETGTVHFAIENKKITVMK